MRKTVVGFAFKSGRISSDMMSEYVESGLIRRKVAEQRQKSNS